MELIDKNGAQILRQFERDGVAIIPSFFDLEAEIEPVQKAIYDIIGIVISESEYKIKRPPFSPETFDSGYNELILKNRKLGGVIYDAVKQIPAFVRIVSCDKLEELYSFIRKTGAPGVAAGGYGIRINNPREEKYRAEWHQEYPAQLRSVDGLVFWSPLVSVKPELGPVQVALGSHVEGVIPVYTHDPQSPDKKGAYSLRLENEEELLKKYEIVSPLTNPGDLLIMDYRTIHASGFNTANRSLWSMQIRYFNFENEEGKRIQWIGSYASGIDFTKVHPELIASPKE